MISPLFISNSILGTRSAQAKKQSNNGKHMPIDARAKIAILAFYSVCIFFADTWASMLVFLAISISLCFLMKPQMAKMLKLGVIVYVIAALTLFFNMFIFTGQGFAFSIDGFYRGSFFAARIVLLVMTSLIVCMTTDALSISSAIRSYLSVLAPLKVPVDDISVILSIALRFIPLTAKEFFSIRDAQWSRGASFDEGPVLERVKAHCSILIPLFINMFRKADYLSMSMDARGYGISGVKRCDINACGLSFASIVIAALICICCLLSAIFL